MWAAPLLHDNIAGQEITTQQSIAPMVRIGAGLPLAPKVGVGLEATGAWGGYSADYGGTSTDLGNITTLSFLANLERTDRAAAALARRHRHDRDDSRARMPGSSCRAASWNALFSAGLDYYRAAPARNSTS